LQAIKLSPDFILEGPLPLLALFFALIGRCIKFELEAPYCATLRRRQAINEARKGVEIVNRNTEVEKKANIAS